MRLGSGLPQTYAKQPARFGNVPDSYKFITNEEVASYGKAVAGSPFLRMYTTPDPSGNFDWSFAHREKGRAAVHVLPVITDAKGRQYLHTIIQKSPVMGGRPIVQLPAGTWGDHDIFEGALTVAQRELKEETGYDVKSVRPLAPQLFATSAGMTTEQKTFALAHATGTPSTEYQEPQEKVSIIGSFDVPLSTIRTYSKFVTWLGELNRRGYTVGMDILAARALLPPNKQLNTEA